MKNKLYVVMLSAWVVIAFSCQRKAADLEDTVSKLPEKRVEVPVFSADSAYNFVEKQVNFGPRVPNSKAHRITGDYLVKKLKSYGAEVTEQRFEATTFDNETLYLRNIIAGFFPEKQKRILLAAHWDTRPFADKDEDEARRNEPIDGANDGASGVAVLLEIGRKLHENPEKPEVGVDIIFFDGEDWGELNSGPRKRTPQGLDSWWCLGSQYWSKNKHLPNYSAYYGILVDMVGARNAQFHVEGLSSNYAGKVVKKIWNWGNALGYSHLFVYDKKPAITDDHKYVNEIARIPMVNIVHYDQEYGYFGDFHHSHKDNLELIDKNVLKGVGETLLYVIYHE